MKRFNKYYLIEKFLVVGKPPFDKTVVINRARNCKAFHGKFT